jgi:ribonuclease T2
MILAILNWVQHSFGEKMRTVRSILCSVLIMISAAVEAGWTDQDEQACDENTAGQFKYYVLSLSWSPEFCRSHPRNNETQCKQHREFIVHGLWPQCGTDFPQNCKDGGAADAIDQEKIYAFMPSDILIDHEWDKHGACSGLSRSAYFDLAGKLYNKIKLPRLSGAPKAEKIEELFRQNNSGLDADDLYLSCTENGPRRSNKTLDEVRICFDKESQEFTRCEVNAKDTCRRLKKVTVTRPK